MGDTIEQIVEGRVPHPDLLRTYETLCAIPSDINKHLPALRTLAERCEHVTEFGMRGAVSTTALLTGQPKKLISWDLDLRAVCGTNSLALASIAGRTTYQPRVGNTLEIEIEPTEFLFIDSLHTYEHLKAELERHADKVSRYLAFHDTTTFGKQSEDGSWPGLRQAIYGLQLKRNFTEWTVKYENPANNGFLVLERIR